MESSRDAFIGKMIRGYVLEKKLGQGSMTAVYSAQTRERWQIPQVVIVLFLLPENIDKTVKEAFKERFLIEARKIAAYEHPHLLSPFGSGEQDDLCYLMMTQFDGQSLLAKQKQKPQFSPFEALSLLTSVASALEYLHHQQSTFYFLNPANIVFSSQNLVQVTGLGLHTLLAQKYLLHLDSWQVNQLEHLKNIAGVYHGKAEYLAPEVVKGGEGDLRSDVYALGILLFELLSGRPPFQGKVYQDIAQSHILEPLPSLHNICKEIPVALELVVNQALQRDPDQRFQTPQQLVDAFMHVLNTRMFIPTYIPLLETVEKLQLLPPVSPSPMQHVTTVIVASQVEKQNIEQRGIVAAVKEHANNRLLDFTEAAENDIESSLSLSAMVEHIHEQRMRLQLSMNDESVPMSNLLSDAPANVKRRII